MHPSVQILCLCLVVGGSFAAGIFAGSLGQDDGETDDFEKALEFLILYHLQPDLVKEKEVTDFLISLGQIEEQVQE